MVDMVARRVILWSVPARRRRPRQHDRLRVPPRLAPAVHLNFWTDDMAGVGPKDGMDKGGVLHAIVGSLIELGIGLAITLPLGSAPPSS
jgi:ABC-type phosphate transport system permease subunit